MVAMLSILLYSVFILSLVGYSLGEDIVDRSNRIVAIQNEIDSFHSSRSLRAGGGMKHVSVPELEGKVVTGQRGKALFLVKNGNKLMFPDFYTYSQMGFDSSMIQKVPDDLLHGMPLGEPIPKIQAPPPFRPDDYMYHAVCDDPDRLINELGVIANVGNFERHVEVMNRIKNKKSMDILALGGSITAGGYFEYFKKLLIDKLNYTITVHNHGHGATEITYSIFCVDISKYEPDLVMIDFAVNDYGHPKLMEALIRKVLTLPSNPVVLLANFWVAQYCPPPRYLLHAWHYDLPLVNICPAVNVCYGKAHLPSYIYHKYSTTDGVHPWGVEGVPFIGKILFAWWTRYASLFSGEDEKPFSNYLFGPEKHRTSTYALPSTRIYADKPLGACTRCDALVDDADSKLEPIGKPVGFEVVTRVKIGYGGFNPAETNSSTKSFKRSWQATTAGSTISFPFYGTSVKIAMWQRRDEMGIIDAIVDGDRTRVSSASGFFKGFTWAMEKNNTGRSEIVTLFEGLPDTEHVLTLTVSERPANVWVKGHIAQIFALLTASDNPNCKTMSFKSKVSS